MKQHKLVPDSMANVVSKDAVRTHIAKNGFAVVRGAEFDLSGLENAWQSLTDNWMDLEVDAYMADHGRYRLRRYGRFFFRPATSELKRLPHATVFQSQQVNNFAGGIHRNFAPLRPSTFENPCLLALIRFDFDCFGTTDPVLLSAPWEVWIHQIRIQSSGNSEVRPAPEGIHHDGHDFIVMHLVGRHNVVGGVSSVYDNLENLVHSCSLEHPLDTIYADDHRVMHAVSPIRAADDKRLAYRDILIIDFDHKPSLLAPA
jgi:hypothetical protein